MYGVTLVFLVKATLSLLFGSYDGSPMVPRGRASGGLRRSPSGVAVHLIRYRLRTS